MMFDFFKPVDRATNTDVYLEIGRRRWEGTPAIVLFWALLVLPWMLSVVFLAGWLSK